MSDTFRVVVAAGSLRSADEAATTFPHAWTEAGVTVETAFNGACLLHLSVAACVLNDTYREARGLDIGLAGVRVTAEGRFDGDWASQGVEYAVELDTAATDHEQAALLARVDEVAEVPRALRAGAPVTRVR